MDLAPAVGQGCWAGDGCKAFMRRVLTQLHTFFCPCLFILALTSSSSLTGLCAFAPSFRQRCPDRSFRDLFCSASSFLESFLAFSPISKTPSSACLLASSPALNFS